MASERSKNQPGASKRRSGRVVLIAVAVLAAAVAGFAAPATFQPRFSEPVARIPAVRPPRPRIIDVSAAPYFAKGDGSDETAKIQRAIADLDKTGGATLWFPRGTYAVRSIPGSVASSLFTISNLSQVRVAGDEATITDLTSYDAPVASITSAATTATVTTGVPHGFASGNLVAIYGAIPAAYDGIYRIRVTSPTTFTYAVDGAPSAASGQIQALSDGTLFRFVGCRNISIDGLKFTAVRKPDFKSPHGLHFVVLAGGSSAADIQASFDGGFAAVAPMKLPRALDSERSSFIHADITADHVERPYFAYFSGDDCSVQIKANWSGRDFIVVGARRTIIDVDSVDQQGSSEIDQLSGVSNEDLTIHVRNRSSSRQNSQNPQVIIQWGDTVPAAIRHVKIVFDVAFNPQPDAIPFGAVLGIWKLGPTLTPDSLPRGDVIDGLDVSGVMQPWAARDIVSMEGAFDGSGSNPDSVRGVVFHDIICSDLSAAHPHGINFAAGSALEGTLELTNISAPAAVINVTNTTGRVVQRGVTAYDLTASAADESPQDFINCIATSGANTSVTNKWIVGTSIGGH